MNPSILLGLNNNSEWSLCIIYCITINNYYAHRPFTVLIFDASASARASVVLYLLGDTFSLEMPLGNRLLQMS